MRILPKKSARKLFEVYSSPQRWDTWLTCLGHWPRSHYQSRTEALECEVFRAQTMANKYLLINEIDAKDFNIHQPLAHGHDGGFCRAADRDTDAVGE
jgi:hypothetical protein